MQIRRRRENVSSRSIRNTSTNSLKASLFSGVNGQIRIFHSGTLSPQMNLGAEIEGQTFSIVGQPTQTSLPVMISLGKPTTATEWLDHNVARLAKYAGKYVAITHSGIVANADDLDEVYYQAKKRGVMNPLVFKVPKATSRPKVVSAKVL